MGLQLPDDGIADVVRSRAVIAPANADEADHLVGTTMQDVFAGTVVAPATLRTVGDVTAYEVIGHPKSTASPHGWAVGVLIIPNAQGVILVHAAGPEAEVGAILDRVSLH